MNISNFPRHCGTKIFHDLWSLDRSDRTLGFNKKWHRTAMAIYIDSQREQYEYLKIKYKILYQSPLLKNPSTGRQYFIVIYLNQKP